MSNEQQARKDAEADAETLRKACRKAWNAGYIGGQAVGAMVGEFQAVPSFAHRQARIAARAAFRAVPALRGDR